MGNFPVTTIDGVSQAFDAMNVESLQRTLRGKVLVPDSNGYDDARSIWNGMHRKRPALIIQCTGAADVVDTVNFAREHRLQTAIRGGGHNVAGTALSDGGLVIDLSRLRGVRVDPRARIADVEPGALLGDVDRETQPFGLVVPAGLVSTTGIAGLTLGGGVGWVRRKFGMSIDNLLSVNIVAADGSFLQASADENADLFWAIRGGGGNFGVVTSFRFQLQPLGPMVYFAAPMYAIEDAAALEGFLQCSIRRYQQLPAIPNNPCHRCISERRLE